MNYLLFLLQVHQIKQWSVKRGLEYYKGQNMNALVDLHKLTKYLVVYILATKFGCFWDK